MGLSRWQFAGWLKRGALINGFVSSFLMKLGSCLESYQLSARGKKTGSRQAAKKARRGLRGVCMGYSREKDQYVNVIRAPVAAFGSQSSRTVESRQ
jgi:hypothetical protein